MLEAPHVRIEKKMPNLRRLTIFTDHDRLFLIESLYDQKLTPDLN